MNKYILNTLPVEFKALYTLACTQKIENRTLINALRDAVQQTRYRSRSSTDDKLLTKLTRYGNKGQWGQDKIRALSRIIYESKGVPSESVGEWLSVEIECIFISDNKVNQFVAYCRKQGYAKLVTVKNDGSINARGEDAEDSCGDCDDCENGDRCENRENNGLVGKEIVVSFTLAAPQVLQAICAKLIELGCTVNKTCGLHVHFDCRNLVARQVTTIGKRVANCVPALKQMLPKSRQNNTYCRDIINKHSKNSSRYAFVNLQAYSKHSTLEIRGHSGTIDAEKMLNWIRVLKVIMSKRNTASFNDVASLVANFNFGDTLKAYILERAAKFTKDVAGDDVAQDSETMTQTVALLPPARFLVEATITHTAALDVA
jgi:hypothetical protein